MKASVNSKIYNILGQIFEIELLSFITYKPIFVTFNVLNQLFVQKVVLHNGNFF